MPVAQSVQILDGAPNAPGILSSVLYLYGESQLDLTMRVVAAGTLTRIDVDLLVEREVAGQDGAMGTAATPAAGVSTLSRLSYQHDITGMAVPYEVTWRVLALGAAMRFRVRQGAGSGVGSQVLLYVRRVP